MSNLNLSLDDIIKMNKLPTRHRYGPVLARRFSNRSAGRVTSYSFIKLNFELFCTARAAAKTRWSDSMLAEERAAAAFYPIQGGARDLVLETGTKLLISNLYHGCRTLTLLFGRSEGTAEIVFPRRSDAEAAIKRYNHVQLDGKPMKIEIVGVNIGPPSGIPLVAFGGSRNNNGAPIRNDQVRGRGSVRGRISGGARGVGMVEEVVREYLLKILIPIWTCTMQLQRKQVRSNHSSPDF